MRHPPLAATSRGAARRAIPVFFAVVAAAYLAASILGLGLTWDGSYSLFRALDDGWAITPWARVVNIPLVLPVVAARSLTDDPTVLAAIFSLSYLLVPMGSLAASWWVVKDRRPRLFVWAVLGIGLVMLPGQVFPISEALMTTQMAWPVFLAILAVDLGRHARLLLFVGLVMALSHSVAVAIFLGLAATVVLFDLARRTPVRPRLRWVAVFAAFAALALLRTAAGELDPTHTPVLSSVPLRSAFRQGVLGLPLLMLGLAYAGGLCLVAGQALRGRGRGVWARRADLLALILLAGAGTVLLPWAADVHTWWKALDYRFFTLFAAGPVTVLAFADALLSDRPNDRSNARPNARPNRPPGDDGSPMRGWIVLTQAVVILAVLVTASVAYRDLRTQLAAEVEPGDPVCTSLGTLDWAHETPLDHWSVSSTSMVIQGRTPEHVVLPDCRVDLSSGIPLTKWVIDYASYDEGWYDLSGLAVLKPKPAAYLQVETVTDWETGTPHSVTVTVHDRDGGVATGYRGTIGFTSSDPAADLPPAYTFTERDAGLHYFMFEATLRTPGSQWIEAADEADTSIAGRQEAIQVR